MRYILNYDSENIFKEKKTNVCRFSENPTKNNNYMTKNRRKWNANPVSFNTIENLFNS